MLFFNPSFYSKHCAWLITTHTKRMQYSPYRSTTVLLPWSSSLVDRTLHLSYSQGLCSSCCSSPKNNSYSQISNAIAHMAVATSSSSSSAAADQAVPHWLQCCSTAQAALRAEANLFYLVQAYLSIKLSIYLSIATTTQTTQRVAFCFTHKRERETRDERERGTRSELECLSFHLLNLVWASTLWQLTWRRPLSSDFSLSSDFFLHFFVFELETFLQQAESGRIFGSGWNRTVSIFIQMAGKNTCWEILGRSAYLLERKEKTFVWKVLRHIRFINWGTMIAWRPYGSPFHTVSIIYFRCMQTIEATTFFPFFWLFPSQTW